MKNKFYKIINFCVIIFLVILFTIKNAYKILNLNNDIDNDDVVWIINDEVNVGFINNNNLIFRNYNKNMTFDIIYKDNFLNCFFGPKNIKKINVPINSLNQIIISDYWIYKTWLWSNCGVYTN